MRRANPAPQTQAEQASEQYARRVAARLEADLPELDTDIQERLRAARTRAIAARGSAQTAVLPQGKGSAALGRSAWRWPAGLSLAFVLLLCALWFTQQIGQRGEMTNAYSLAQVETDMLLDDVPPLAYADTGFLAYLEQEGGSSTNSTQP